MLSAIILLLIILPLLPALLLAIPTIQNLAIDRAAKWASEKLSTKVEVGHITIGLLNRVAIQDFYVADWDGDTLLYVKHADAYLGSLASLAKGNLVINHAKAEGGKFVVKETVRGSFGVKEITDQLVNREKESNFRLDIRSIDASGIDFSLIRFDEPRNEGVDFANMHLLGMATHIDNLAVKSGGYVSLYIDSLSFVERSGFALDNLKGSLLVDNGKIEIKEGEIRTALSDINIDYLLLDGNDWLKYRDFINNIPIICNISDSKISTDDIGYFAPELWSWKTSLRNTTASMNGTVANFLGKITNATLEDGGTLRGSARVQGLIDVEKTKFDIKVDRLRASTDEIAYLLNNIAHLSLGDKAAVYVERIKNIDASGEFKGTIRGFKAKAKSSLKSGGVVALECSMQNPAEGRKEVKATIEAEELNLSALLVTTAIGNTTFKAEADVELGDEQPLVLKGGGAVQSIMLNGHNYNDLTIVADIEDNRIAGSLGVNDEALRLDAQALLDLTEKSEPLYDAVMSVMYADLHKMNINNRDSVSILHCDVGLSARGTSLDNLNGMLRVADAEYETVGRSCDADLVELSIKSDEDARTLTLSSDFADAVFESRTPYKNVIYYLKNLLAQYAPLLYDKEARENIGTHIAEIGKELAILSVTTKEIDPLLGCITDGLEMAEGSKVEMLVSPSDNRFLMRASSEYLMHKNYLATNIDVKAGNANDSLSMSLAAEDLYAGSFHFSGVGIEGGAKDNDIRIDAIFADSVRDLTVRPHATRRIRFI